jgi:predicted RNA-binding protein (virulence factor B family)
MNTVTLTRSPFIEWLLKCYVLNFCGVPWEFEKVEVLQVCDDTRSHWVKVQVGSHECDLLIDLDTRLWIQPGDRIPVKVRRGRYDRKTSQVKRA